VYMQMVVHLKCILLLARTSEYMSVFLLLWWSLWTQVRDEVPSDLKFVMEDIAGEECKAGIRW